MAMADSQQSWIPYDGGRDCSQGFCSVYCPQWCYALFPPPPPFSPSVAEDDDYDSGNPFSPLVIVVIGILATALVVFSYYTFVSKYRASVSFRRQTFHARPTVDGEDGGDHQWQRHEGWQVSPTTGLDEAQISKIKVCRYKRGEGLVEGTDCSVCLSEFSEDDHLRLLPKCSHAFHLQCIDTWLKSHSNCPLCRANILSVTPAMAELESVAGASLASEQEREMVVVIENVGRNVEEEDMEEEDGNVAVEEDEDILPVRRSLSMSSSHQERVSIAEVLQMEIEDELMKKQGNGGENCKGSGRSCRQHCVVGPVRIKRSLSIGRNHFERQGREKNSLLPV